MHGRPLETINAIYHLPAARLHAFPLLRVSHVRACVRQALKDARKVVPTTMAMSSPSLSASSSRSSSASELAVAGGADAGDVSIVSRALLPPGAGPVATAGRVEAEAAAAVDDGRHGDGLSYVEKLEMRAEDIMERVLGLAAFCERAGAAKDLDVSVSVVSGLVW